MKQLAPIRITRLILVVWAIVVETQCGYVNSTFGDGVEFVYRETNHGPVKGLRTELVDVFYGIPYAKPPVGKLRWRHPQKIRSWKPNVREAVEPQAWCMQTMCAPGDTFFTCPPKVSEDCLYLNIWTPKGPSFSPRPVMVFIHGGNFVGMGSTSVLFDGRFLVSKGDVILVNFNYRLGALGFLMTDEHGEENFGIADQLMAIQWVHQNIHHFGGDKHKITLFGQSAGAHSTMIHMTKADSQQYFRNAIIESLPFTIALKTANEARYMAAVFAEKIGCVNFFKTDMRCLRSKSPEEVVTATNEAATEIISLRFLEMFQPWEPWLDDMVVPMNPLDALEAGAFFEKPLIIGTLTEEALLYVYGGFTSPLNIEEYILAVEATIVNPLYALRSLSYYPPPLFGDTRKMLSVIGTDYVFGCSTRHAGRLVLSKGVNVWLYIFDHVLSFHGAWRDSPFCEDHACHGEDLGFVFQTASLAGFNFSNNEMLLSDAVIHYFTNFAKGSDPNYSPDPPDMNWPVHEASTEWSSLRFKTPESGVVHNYRTSYCDFLDSVGYRPF